MTSIAEATDQLAEHGAAAQVIAGGTDVMIQQARGEITPRVLVHIGRIPELSGITAEGGLRIGPLTTHLALARDARVRAVAPCLAEASATVGGWQTQAVGTIGGNVCNASPAADTAPPLLVAGASFELTGRSGTRIVTADEFFLGRRKTARAADELLTAITMATPPGGTGEVYLKVGRRSAMEVAIVGLAVRLTIDPDGTVERARIAVCSVAPRPFRAVEAEALLQGSRLEDGAVAKASQALVRAASPIDDARATASYRLMVLPKILTKAIRIAAERAERSAA